jgi:hypothetical protein
MNRWLQTKQYTCPCCGARYVHDRAYQHGCFECPNRLAPKHTVGMRAGARARSLARAADGTADLDPMGLAAVPAECGHRMKFRR